MKKILLIGGLSSIGYAFYYFFKKQLDLALSFTYKIKNFEVKEITSKDAKVKATIQVKNNSSFEIEVINYDLDFIYKNAKLINAKSTRPIMVNADSNFDIEADGLVNFKALGSIAFDLVKDAFANKPINIKVNGSVKVKFIGFVQTVEIQGDEFIVSQNLLEDLSLDDDVDKGKAKVNKIIGFLGLKI